MGPVGCDCPGDIVVLCVKPTAKRYVLLFQGRTVELPIDTIFRIVEILVASNAVLQTVPEGARLEAPFRDHRQATGNIRRSGGFAPLGANPKNVLSGSRGPYGRNIRQWVVSEQPCAERVREVLLCPLGKLVAFEGLCRPR